MCNSVYQHSSAHPLGLTNIPVVLSSCAVTQSRSKLYATQNVT